MSDICIKLPDLKSPMAGMLHLLDFLFQMNVYKLSQEQHEMLFKMTLSLKICKLSFQSRCLLKGSRCSDAVDQSKARLQMKDILGLKAVGLNLRVMRRSQEGLGKRAEIS